MDEDLDYAEEYLNRYGDGHEILPRSAHGNPAWHAERARGITATDARAILGVDASNKTVFTVYWAKKLGLGEKVNKRMKTGQDWETFVAGLAWAKGADENDWTDQRMPGLMANVDNSWQMASCDMIVVEDSTWIPVEIKTSGQWDGWGPDGSTEVPLGYRVQVQWQMQVMRAPFGYLACIMPDHVVRMYRIEHDDEDSSFMVAQCRHFLEHNIMGDNPPPIIGTESELGVLKQITKPVDGEATVVAKDLVTDLAHLRAMSRDYDKMAKKVEAQIRSALGEASLGTDEDGNVLVKRSRTPRKGYTVEDGEQDKLTVYVKNREN